LQTILDRCSGNLAGDTTGVLAVLEPDETILTPVSAPRVSYDPISALVGRVAGKLDGVIDGGSALVSIEDTSGVVLPWLSIAADGERHALKGGVDSTFFASDGGDGGDLQVSVRSALAAGTLSVLAGVRVAFFGILSSLVDDPLEGFLGITSLASIVVGVAVNNFLRTSDGHGVVGHQVGRLNGFSGRESPARSALFLVLDWGGLSLGDPVDGSSGGIGVDEVGGDGVKRLSRAETEQLLELFSGPVGVLRISESGAAAVLVHFGDLVGGHDEVAELFLTLEGSSVGLVPELVVLVEGLRD